MHVKLTLAEPKNIFQVVKPTDTCSIAHVDVALAYVRAAIVMPRAQHVLNVAVGVPQPEPELAADDLRQDHALKEC
jgi:hypothetical protein